MKGLVRTDLDRSRPPIELLDEEVEAFVAYIRPTVGEHQLRQRALQCFARVVERVWPSATVELFGSTATGLYLPNGDFDVVVTDPSLLRYPTQHLLTTLRSALVSSGFVRSSDVRLIENARVPLVKIVSAPKFGSFAMDVSFNSTTGPAGVRESLRLLQELDERGDGKKVMAKSLVFVFKTLLDSLGLSEVRWGGLGGLSVFCMVVSFAQLDKRDTTRRSAGRDLLELLFKYGFTWDYENDVIVTAEGGSVENKSFFGWRGKRLSIQHPIDLDRDLTSGSYDIDNIRRRLRAAYGDLHAYVDPAHPMHGDAFSPTRSALALIGIRLDPAVLERRRANEVLLHEGALARLAKTWAPQVGAVPKPPPVARRTHGSDAATSALPSATPPALPAVRSFSNGSNGSSSASSFSSPYPPSPSPANHGQYRTPIAASLSLSASTPTSPLSYAYPRQNWASPAGGDSPTWGSYVAQTSAAYPHYANPPHRGATPASVSTDSSAPSFSSPMGSPYAYSPSSASSSARLAPRPGPPHAVSHAAYPLYPSTAALPHQSSMQYARGG
ncbi:uncharacterized protein JCM10292_004748 [Rhodotorula paludigena]|uniref:uncharacterized protein n=1 Tax=Rhodotorula paludigena TaxID=86838 RepID=UPI00316F21BF